MNNQEIEMFYKKPMKVLVSSLVLLLIILSILAGVLFLYSPGKLKPFTDGDGKFLEGSLREKVFVTIGGVKQGMIIEGKNLNNPVLLYVHGGPAFPNYFLIDKYAPGLEDIFTVCYWEQRGGGLSYSRDVSLESMTYEQLYADAIEVTNYLRKRFGKEKIYLMAHSGGTPFAIQAAATAPQLYNAYIGMAQITQQAESEKLAYRYILKQYTDQENRSMLEKLKKFPVLQSDSMIVPFYKSLVRDESMHELGIGTMHSMRSVLTGVFIPVWMCKAYTLREKINIWTSKFSFVKKTKLIDQLFSTDIPAKVPRIEIPVYFFSGKYDLTVNVNLSRAYLEKIVAPVKGFYTFDNSAHSPLFEEPQRCKGIIIGDVLNGTSDRADKN